MADSIVGRVVGLVLVMALVAPPCRVTAITCSDVKRNLLPCLPYIGSGGKVAPACCSGLRSLVAAGRTTYDRRTTCKCLKEAAAKLPGENLSRANSLPGKCRVTIPYPISPSIDCSKIK